MSIAWTLRCASGERSLAQWGVANLVRRRTSQAADLVTFTLPGTRVDDAFPFAADDEIAILRDGVQWFVGRVTGLKPSASGGSETLDVTVAGPWWYLENLVFQQVWTVLGSSLHSSHCILNTRPVITGTPLLSAEQIGDALQWASDQAAATYGAPPFQWDVEEFPDVQIPADEVRDITCAEVIRRQLRWVPDAVTWWDYATSPPTFRCRRRADLPSVDITLGTTVTELGIVPRHDLLVPAVVLKYERVDQVDGASRFFLDTDAAPEDATGQEFGALVATIDLQPFQISTASTHIIAQSFPASDDAAAWWVWLKKREPWLASPVVTLRELVSVTRTPTENPEAALLPRELLQGPVPEWTGKASQTETATAIVKLSVASGDYHEVLTKTVTVNITTTDASTGTLSTTESVVVGETPPIGLAGALYDALSTLEYQGQIVVVREDVDDGITLGHRLNVHAGRAEWASMAALIQETVDAVDTGTTTVAFGPPEQLGPRDMVELLRINRFRQTFTASSARSGSSRTGGSVSIGGGTPGQNASAVSTVRERMRLAVTNGTVDIDASKAVGRPMEIREIEVCVDGLAKRMLVLCSDPYEA